MDAEEIRKKNWVPGIDGIWLQEIAAQLAQLNTYLYVIMERMLYLKKP